MKQANLIGHSDHVTNRGIYIPETPESEYTLPIHIKLSEAIIQAEDDYDNGDFHLFDAMTGIEEVLEGSDRAYFNEMKFLINARRSEINW